MKTTYKLLGLHWDGMPQPFNDIEIIESDGKFYQSGLPIEAESVTGETAINASDIFAAKSLEDVDALIEGLGNVERITVLDDFTPPQSGEVIRAFCRKRLYQACGYIQQRRFEIRIQLVLSCQRRGFDPITTGKRYVPIDNLTRFVQLIGEYTDYLAERGIRFDPDGFPLLDRACFLDEWPDQVVTYKYRNSSLVGDKRRTALCFFAPDQQIYPRLAKVLCELGEYRRYLGIVMIDTTVTQDMDVEWQAATMLLNQLFMAVLAVNGIKVIANMRSGSDGTERYLGSVPCGVMWACGRLGCERLENAADAGFMAKVLSAAPSKLLLYGPPDRCAESQLQLMGVDYRRYPDVHAQYSARKRRCPAA